MHFTSRASVERINCRLSICFLIHAVVVIKQILLNRREYCISFFIYLIFSIYFRNFKIESRMRSSKLREKEKRCCK